MIENSKEKLSVFELSILLLNVDATDDWSKSLSFKILAKTFFWVARRQQFSKPWNEQMILFMKCEVSYLTTWFFSESRICRPQKNHNECEKFLEKNHEKWNAVAIITWEAKLYQTVLNFSLTFQNSIHFAIVWKKK